MKNIQIKQEIQGKDNIILIFGIPTSGKSILTYNTFIKDSKEVENKKDIMKYVECDDCFILGSYNNESSNRNGLDSLERKQVGNLAQQVMNLSNKGKNIILEGIRGISRPMMKKLLDNGYTNIKMIWVDCGVDVALNRCSTSRTQSIERQTKGINSVYSLIKNFERDMRVVGFHFWYVDTSKCNDFSNKTFYDFDVVDLGGELW